mmetsp:Transcript_52671/g.160097  ORF Transcript_52671/g.160097 Transcript_52671/m.160097 type:complete len:614 (-) Transcript_52671:69-1910(-)
MAPRASPSASGSERLPSARGAEPQAGQAGRENLTFGPDEVLRAVQSLYRDQVKPCGRVILRRLREHAAQAIALSAGVPADSGRVDSVPWVDPERVRGLCESSPRLRVMREQGREYSVSIMGMPACFVDARSDEDVYPEAFWAQLTEYIVALQGDDVRLPGGRYACAYELLRRGVPCLTGRSLGQVCHIVQVAISRRRILGHLQCDLVPFQHSVEWAREHAALNRQPRACQHPPDKPRLPLATFDDVRTGLIQLLRGDAKRAGRSFSFGNMKKIFRLQFHMELSETALGYSKLHDLLNDPRLGDICSLQARGQSAFMVKPRDARLWCPATALKAPRVPAGQDFANGARASPAPAREVPPPCADPEWRAPAPAPAAPLHRLTFVDCRPPSPDFANPPAWGCDCPPDAVASGGQRPRTWSDWTQWEEENAAPGAAEAMVDAEGAGLQFGAPRDGQAPLARGPRVCVKNTFVHVVEETSDDEDEMVVCRFKTCGPLGTAARRAFSASTAASDDEGVDERAANGEERAVPRIEVVRELFATMERSVSVKNTFVHFADGEDDTDDEDSSLVVHKAKTMPHQIALNSPVSDEDEEGTRLPGAIAATKSWPPRRAHHAEFA